MRTPLSIALAIIVLALGARHADAGGCVIGAVPGCSVYGDLCPPRARHSAVDCDRVPPGSSATQHERRLRRARPAPPVARERERECGRSRLRGARLLLVLACVRFSRASGAQDEIRAATSAAGEGASRPLRRPVEQSGGTGDRGRGPRTPRDRGGRDRGRSRRAQRPPRVPRRLVADDVGHDVSVRIATRRGRVRA